MLLLSRLPSVLSEFVRLYSINSLIIAETVHVDCRKRRTPGNPSTQKLVLSWQEVGRVPVAERQLRA